jgi:hypothetical protein
VVTEDRLRKGRLVKDLKLTAQPDPVNERATRQAETEVGRERVCNLFPRQVQIDVSVISEIMTAMPVPAVVLR